MTLVLACFGVMLAVWLVCRAAAWLPAYYTREEQAWITAVQQAPDATSAAHSLPASQGLAALWCDFFSAAPPRNRLSAVAAVSIAIMAAILWSSLLPGWLLAVWFGYACGLILLALIDAQTKLLPDILTIPLLWLGLLVQLFPETASVGLEMAVIGAVLGYVPLWLLAQTYRLIRGRDGLGMGDLKLLAVMGAWSGPGVLPQVIFAAALLAIVWFFGRRLLCRDASTIRDELPFGPWLILAYLLIVFVPISF